MHNNLVYRQKITSSKDHLSSLNTTPWLFPLTCLEKRKTKIEKASTGYKNPLEALYRYPPETSSDDALQKVRVMFLGCSGCSRKTHPEHSLHPIHCQAKSARSWGYVVTIITVSRERYNVSLKFSLCQSMTFNSVTTSCFRKCSFANTCGALVSPE